MGKNKKNRSRVNKLEKPNKLEKKNEEYTKSMFEKYKFSRIGSPILNKLAIRV